MTSLTGKTALITGSTDGVGRVVATRLGEAGARVLVHGRDQDRGHRVVAEITQSGGAADSSPRTLRPWPRCGGLATPFGSDGPARHPDQQCRHRHRRRCRARPAPTATSLRFAVNYLAGFLLTHLLLPLLRRSAPARIVNVASAGQQPIDFDDVMLTRGYSGARAYCQSKLAQIMFTIDLAEALAGTGVTVNVLHPATYMDTAMVRRAGVTPRSTVEEGAEAILKLAASPAVEGRSGCYFNGLHEARAERQAYDAAARRQLRAISQELCAGFGIATAPRVGPG